MDYFFTRKDLENYAKETSGVFSYDVVSKLASALLAEGDDRAGNPGVWDGAPEVANECTVYFARREGNISDSLRENKTYTRTLPKTKAREIAERTWKKISHYRGDTTAIDDIEAAILEAQKDGD